MRSLSQRTSRNIMLAWVGILTLSIYLLWLSKSCACMNLLSWGIPHFDAWLIFKVLFTWLRSLLYISRRLFPKLAWVLLHTWTILFLNLWVPDKFRCWCFSHWMTWWYIFFSLGKLWCLIIWVSNAWRILFYYQQLITVFSFFKWLILHFFTL